MQVNSNSSNSGGSIPLVVYVKAPSFFEAFLQSIRSAFASIGFFILSCTPWKAPKIEHLQIDRTVNPELLRLLSELQNVGLQQDLPENSQMILENAFEQNVEILPPQRDIPEQPIQRTEEDQRSWEELLHNIPLPSSFLPQSIEKTEEKRELDESLPNNIASENDASTEKHALNLQNQNINENKNVSYASIQNTTSNISQGEIAQGLNKLQPVKSAPQNKSQKEASNNGSPSKEQLRAGRSNLRSVEKPGESTKENRTPETPKLKGMFLGASKMIDKATKSEQTGSDDDSDSEWD